MKVLVGSCRLKGCFGHGWFLIVGETKDDRQQSASKSQKHQAQHASMFCEIYRNMWLRGANRSFATCRVVLLVGLMFASTRKRPHGVNVGRLVGSLPCFGLVYKSCGTRWQRRGRTAIESPLVVRANRLGLVGSRQQRCRRRVLRLLIVRRS